MLGVIYTGGMLFVVFVLTILSVKGGWRCWFDQAVLARFLGLTRWKSWSRMLLQFLFIH